MIGAPVVHVMHPMTIGGPGTTLVVHHPTAGWFWLGVLRMPTAEGIAVIRRADNDEGNDIAERELRRAGRIR